MKAERWQQIEKICQSALEMEESQRATYLEQTCAGDEVLRQEVEALLRYDRRGDRFIEQPALEVAAKMMAQAKPESLVGQQIGSYQIHSVLGAGGMGQVYRARDTKLGREAAIKILPREFSFDPERVRRFEQEARAASALNHPNIITIYEMGQADPGVYIAMELVDGKTLREVLGSGPLPTKRILYLATQVADGLAKAHAAGITHRDLKPENLMITKDGLVKILDFGLAKQTPLLSGGEGTEVVTLSGVTEPGILLGTMGYMSPEQASGRAVDFHSDQFSLGVILYEMATGKRAFQRSTAAETLTAVIRDEPKPIAEQSPKTPLQMRWIIERCLAKEPRERYGSTWDLARELQSVQDHLSELGITEPAMSLVASPSARTRRLRVLAAIGLAVGLLVVVGAFFLSRSVDKPPLTFHLLTFRHGHITGARFAADGQTIVYGATWADKPSELYATRSESPESRSLGLQDTGIFSISSSGEMAIALGCTQNWGQCTGTLAQASLNGGAPREMMKDVYYADWAPDGKSLAVAAIRGGEYRLECPIGKLLYKTSGWMSFPRISPKGDLIAFLDYPTLLHIAGSVCVVDLKGKKRTVSAGWKGLHGLAWSADGDEIWFTGSRVSTSAGMTLHAVTLAGRERVIFGTPGFQIRDISRDGRRVLLVRGTARASIISFTPASSKERDLAWFDFSTAADLSVDGKTLLFYEYGVGVKATPTVYLRKTDGSDAVRLGEGKPLALSPDGKLVLMLQQTTPAQLILLPTGPGEQRLLPRGSIQEYTQWAVWSPDGSRIFFSGSEAGHRRRTYVQDIGGGDPRPVTSEGMTGVLLSPEGKRIAAFDRYGEYYLCPVEGGEPRPIEGLEEGDGLLQWSADGRSFFVRAAGDLVLKIYKLDLASGRRELWKVLTPPDPAALIGIGVDPGEVRLTPDGKSYVYTCWTYPEELYLVEGLK